MGYASFLALALWQYALAQNLPHTDIYLQGYAKTDSGATISHASPLSDVFSALICRATDGRSSIAWQTEMVHAVHNARAVTFVWLAGLGCTLGQKQFVLSVNGKATVSFTTSNQDSWEAAGGRGALLAFQTVMIDRRGDRFGFLKLSLPESLATPGAPVALQVTGEAARSLAWVMTFKTGLVEGARATAPPVIERRSGKTFQPLNIEIVNVRGPMIAALHIDSAAPETLHVPVGITHHSLELQPVKTEAKLEVSLNMGREEQKLSITVKPVRPWVIYMVQQSHTDIGYTRPQTEILADHLRFIDCALDYCDQTDDYPDDAKFRWTCETAWPVREYLKSRPAHQIARLRKRTNEGRIEVTAMLLNWAEVADENALVHSLDAIKMLRDSALPVRAAVQDDVNGLAWGLVDYLHGLGIDYVSVGINATRSLRPFKVPTPFWWESPSGKRVLAFRADHYSTGNFLGIHNGDPDLFAHNLFPYLQQLDSAGYPFNSVSMQFCGYFTDNSPPSKVASEIIRRWNEKYAWPRLRSSTIGEFLQWVGREHGARLPTFRAAWPDWWTDGFGSALRETAAGRQAQCDLIAGQGLLSLAQLSGATVPRAMLSQMQSVADQIHFYNEHTFGAEESISDPLSGNACVEWAEKSSFAWQALMQSHLFRETALRQIEFLATKSAEPSVVVFNTLNWTRSGLHTLFIDRNLTSREYGFQIVDDRGREIAAQFIESRAEGDTWALWVEDVPAFGYRIYRILTTSTPRLAEPALVLMDDTLENAFYRLVLDRSNGAIKSVYDLELHQELLDPQRSWQLAQLIYERLADRSGMEELRLGAYTRSTLDNIRMKPGRDGNIWQSVVLTGRNHGFVVDEGVSCEIRLFKRVKRIDLVFRARKLGTTDPEAVYVAFPFALPGGALVFEAQGGIVSPGENQLPGTASDWNTVQNFASVRAPKAQIVLVSDEIPLIQFGGINTGRYQYEAKPATQQMYSWVLNNYWTTNFRASQEGDMTWTYVLTSGADPSNSFASRFGWGIRVPLVSCVLPGRSGSVDGKASQSFWPFKPSTVLLVSSRPAQKGIFLCLREMEGRPATLELENRPARWQFEEVNALGIPLRPLSSVPFEPFETKFLHVWR